MSNFSLDVLKQHRDALLLAEATGWLHDYRKCSDEKIKGGGLPRPELGKQYPSLTRTSLSVLSVSEVLSTLLNDWEKKAADTTVSFLLQFLSRCHNTSHFDKQEPIGGEQNYPDVKISSPFGVERNVPGSLTTQLWGLPWTRLNSYSSTEREQLRSAINTLFSQTVADTRRPINEVDLWSWGLSVGALYKAALAETLLGYQRQPNELRWRLLSVRVGSAGYLDTATRLPDLLARQKLLTDAFDRVRVLLEETYPLGAEVYRDENGSVFVMPNIENLLESVNDTAQSLRTLITSEFNIAGEIVPEITLDSTAWWGQDPVWEEKKERNEKPKDEIPPIGTVLVAVPLSHPNSRQIVSEWKDRTSDVCPVCGLRPQADPRSDDTKIRKAGERKVCVVCEQRRVGRAKDWADEKFNTTIWTDEVADVNGRLALLVGQLDLSKWLDGTMVQTLTVTEPQDGQATLKNPSFARLRRVWETTRRFWSKIQEEVSYSFTDDRRRLRIWLDPKPDLGDYQVYELDLDKTMLSVMWCDDGDKGYLISTDNLGYTAQQLGAKKDIYTDPATAAIFVEDYVRERFVNGRQKEPILRNPETASAERRRNLLEGCRIVKTDHEDAVYTTTIPILAEPRTFMALVPANRALEVVKAIKAKYEREMSKVRNRLPLTLGVVYFGRRTPLAAALDAGRRMLEARVTSDRWQVTRDAETHKGNAPEHLHVSKHFDEWVEVRLSNGAHEISLRVSTVMGDGTTQDVWYPYWRVEEKPKDRTRWFIGPDGEHWVRVSELKQGDTVQFMPSTFDFEFLDTTARRFEVSYENGQRRGEDKRQRPYLLEELDDLEQTWKEISRLSKSQIYMLESLIETKRKAWDKPRGEQALALPDEDVFKQFVRDALKEAESYTLHLERAAVSGMLTDALELHLTIMREEKETQPEKEG